MAESCVRPRRTGNVENAPRVAFVYEASASLPTLQLVEAPWFHLHRREGRFRYPMTLRGEQEGDGVGDVIRLPTTGDADLRRERIDHRVDRETVHSGLEPCPIAL